ncbi:MAG: coproporphyrinogen dehydrogenase HemZ [Ruminococcaceae bacterium]|nr:coproporphyrinogen dehydrogenase HemZ [Oscillospiraceae bacterium]
MKLYIDGPINKYYVQTLCMIYFPGSKFSDDEEVGENTPQLWVSLNRNEDGTGVDVTARLTLGDRSAEAARHYDYRSDYTRERVEKIALGDAVTAVGNEITGYFPAWGMLTGVRPSKVASELLRHGHSKTKVKRDLNKDFFVIPKKASLATDVALNEARLIGTPDKKDCSVYVSIPFCPSKCAYCSFVSYTSRRLLSLIPDYLRRLLHDLDDIFNFISARGLNLKTVYIGGGTPTILDAEQLQLLLSCIARHTDVGKLQEFTLEAGRPDTITEEKLKVAVEYGVSRISVNPQILSDEVLSGIGRMHTVDEFYRAYELARNSGIRTINTDLIAGLPGDTFKIFSGSFDRLLELAPENITVHTFCVKKSAELRWTGENIYSIRGGDTGKCVDYSQIKCARAGYLPYYMYRQKNSMGNFENVGFSLPEHEGLYNIYMMEELHSIFAAGAGAVTKMVDYDAEGGVHKDIQRLFSPKYPYEYLDENGKVTMMEKLNKIEQFYTEKGI